MDWKAAETLVKEEHRTGALGRFAAGLPPVSDGLMLFLQHLVSKMRPVHEGGGRAGIVLNGSPLFTGGAESGPSKIRQWLLEEDLVDAIVALPTGMFFNTGIATYIWVIERSKFLRARLKGVEDFRAKSKAASTKDAAATPHLFRQIAQPDTSYLCIPAHGSDARPYFLTARFGPEVIASNANLITLDADGFMFSIISSTMFLIWQRTVGGRLESRLRFNKLLTWNTFPMPRTDETIRDRIINAGAEVLRVRAEQPDVPLTDLYDPSSISPELQAAHTALDTVVDRQFGLERGSHPELERQEILFARYQELTAPLLVTTAQKKRRR